MLPNNVFATFAVNSCSIDCNHMTATRDQYFTDVQVIAFGMVLLPEAARYGRQYIRGLTKLKIYAA